jgi:hypothetical protein
LTLYLLIGIILLIDRETRNKVIGMDVNKARKQIAVWVTTNDLVDQLARSLMMSKAEIVHMAVVDMAKQHIDEEEGDE